MLISSARPIFRACNLPHTTQGITYRLSGIGLVDQASGGARDGRAMRDVVRTCSMSAPMRTNWNDSDAIVCVATGAPLLKARSQWQSAQCSGAVCGVDAPNRAS